MNCIKQNMECHFFCFLIILHLCSDPILGQSINEKWINKWTGTHNHGSQCTKCIIGAKPREYICSGCGKDNANKPFTCRRCKDGTPAQPSLERKIRASFFPANWTPLTMQWDDEGGGREPVCSHVTVSAPLLQQDQNCKKFQFTFYNKLKRKIN